MNRALLRLLGVGVAGWAVAAAGWSLWEGAIESDSYAAFVGLLYPHHYLAGGIVMLIYGAAQGVRRRIPVKALAWAAAVYFLPVPPLALAWVVYNATPPEVQDNVMNLTVSLWGAHSVVLYLCGCCLGYVQRGRPFRRVLLSVLAPPLLVASLVAGGQLLFIATSPHWKLRELFAISDEQFQRRPQGGGLALEGRLHLGRAGAYDFQVLFNTEGRLSPLDIQTVVGRGVPIQWLETDHAGPQAEGSYRFRLEVEDNPLQDVDTPLAVSPASRRWFTFEVYAASDLHRRLLKEFSIPVPAVP